jgi:hypothetical protein
MSGAAEVSPGKLKEEERPSKRCTCKKSRCLKKYCECFKGKILCGEQCKCKSCENYEGSGALDSARNIKFKTPAWNKNQILGRSLFLMTSKVSVIDGAAAWKALSAEDRALYDERAEEETRRRQRKAGMNASAVNVNVEQKQRGATGPAAATEGAVGEGWAPPPLILTKQAMAALERRLAAVFGVPEQALIFSRKANDAPCSSRAMHLEDCTDSLPDTRSVQRGGGPAVSARFDREAPGQAREPFVVLGTMQTQRLRCRKSNDPLALRAMHERVYGGDISSISTLKRQKRVADPDDANGHEDTAGAVTVARRDTTGRVLSVYAKKKRKVQGRGEKVK